MARKRTRQEADEKVKDKKQASEGAEKQTSEVAESKIDDKKTQQQSQEESKPSEPSEAAANDSTNSTDNAIQLTDWQAVYDATSARYYFWSPSTNKTQWTNPYEDNATATTTSNEPEYSYAAHFNARTGRFTSDGNGAEKASDFSRAKRQMDFFFDYDKFAEQRAKEIMNPEPKKKLTKAQVERFKQRRKEKKETKKKMWLIND